MNQLPIRTATHRASKAPRRTYSTMSSLFHPYRHRSHRPSNNAVYYRGGPSSFSASPWNSSALYRDSPNDFFSFDQPFHQPFLSLFNDTFSQLDRLSNDLNNHLNESFSADSSSQAPNTWQRMLTLAPKFDIKETDAAFVLEGEVPGVEKKDISLEFADDNTLVLKARSEKVREEHSEPSKADSSAANGDVQMSGANQEAGATKDKASETAVTTTNKETAVTKDAPRQPTYHLTERSVGTFQRVFNLPGELRHDDVKANLRNGVLTVTVPKVVKEPVAEGEAQKKPRTVLIEDVPEEAAPAEAEKSKL